MFGYKTKKAIVIFFVIVFTFIMFTFSVSASSGSLNEVNFDTIVPYNQRMIVSGVTTTATEFVSNRDWTVDYYPSVYWRPVIEGDTGTGGWEVPVSKSFNFIPRFHFKSLPLIDGETYNLQISYFFLAPYNSDITLPTLDTLNVGYYQSTALQMRHNSISKQSSIKVQDDIGDITYYKGYVGKYKGSFTYNSTYPFSELFMNFKFKASSSALGSIRFFGVYGAIIVTSDDTSIEDFLDEEENRSENGGNSAIDSLTGAIPDVKADGIGNAFKNLTNSMSYTGTEAKINFCGIVIPEIPNVCKRTVLLEPQEIDLSRYIEMIPNVILILVQSVLTIALIIFCYKEIVGFINYLMTLKGGGSE